MVYLLKRSSKSKSMIASTCLLIYGSVSLSISYAASNYLSNQLYKDSATSKALHVFVEALPLTANMLGNWLFVYEYLIVAQTMTILYGLTQHAYDANVKLTSRRQCLRAFSIIMIAVCIAHGVDKITFTLKQSSVKAD